MDTDNDDDDRQTAMAKIELDEDDCGSTIVAWTCSGSRSGRRQTMNKHHVKLLETMLFTLRRRHG
jgi:hypothetical protein